MKAMRWMVMGLVLLMAVSALAADNPLKNAKVGEWMEFAMHTETMGQKMEMKMKQTVIAKDATSVTLRIDSTMGTQKLPSSEQKIDLNKPYEPYAADPKVSDAKVTPLGNGSETITVGGKSYKCEWAKVKIVSTKPVAMEGITKVWSSKDVPVTNLVKMETDSTMKVGEKTMQTKMNMELTGSGTGGK